MSAIQFIQTPTDQPQSEINEEVKIILDNFLKKIKNKKRKRKLLKREKEKLKKVILSIVRIEIVLIHLIKLSFIQKNHSLIISFLFEVIITLIKKHLKI